MPFFAGFSKIFPRLCLWLMLVGLGVQVHDGDTITILENGVPRRVRIVSIDCPELGQAYGEAAKQFTYDLCYQQRLTLQPLETDNYGRLVARIYLPDGRNLGRELVKAGYAWYFGRYHPDSALKSQAYQARKEKRGLWEEPRPLPPWKWRRMHPRR